MSALVQLFVHGFSVSMSRNHQSIIAHLILHSSCEVDLAWNYVSSRQHFVNKQNWLKSVKPLSLFLNSKWHFKIESAAQSSGIRHGFWSQSCGWWSKLKGFVQVEKFRTCLLLVLSLASLEITKFPVCAHTHESTSIAVSLDSDKLEHVWKRLSHMKWIEMTSWVKRHAQSRTNLDLVAPPACAPPRCPSQDFCCQALCSVSITWRLPGNFIEF